MTKPLLIGVVALVAMAGVRELTDSSFKLAASLQDFFTLTFSVIIESTPFVVLGIILSALIQVLVSQEAILKFLPKPKLLRRAVLSLFGMLLPVCECGNMPLARGLMLKGFTVPEATTFLLAAPILNPLVIITTHQAFGWDNNILVARLVGGFLIANLIGWLLDQKDNPAEFLTDSFSYSCSHSHESAKAVGFKGKVQKISSLFVEELSAMMVPLILGSAVAGLIQVVVPREILLSVGQDPLLSILAMTILAMVVAICSNVDAFFALSFAGTFLPGGIVAFLLVGPLVDVKMISLMRTTYKVRTVSIIVVSVVALAAIIGLVVNLIA